MKKLLYTILAFIVLFIGLNLIFPFPKPIEYSQIIEADDGTVIDAYLTSDDKWRMYTRLNEITPDLRKAIINKEDKWFFYHLGINPISIARAAFNNVIRGKRTSGASTITMQVARLLEPKPRTIKSKLVEMFRAFQLEVKYSKKEILQLYLNLIPYGGNIEGVKAVSILYFNKLPSQLSLAEITTMCIIPNRPSSLRLGKNNSYIEEERDKWLTRFKRHKVFDEKMINDALEEPLNAKRSSIKKLAPHYALKMKQQFQNYDIIESALNLEIQNDINILAQKHSKHLQFKNINNLSVIVVDNSTHQVVGYIGSQDFDDFDNYGQVDGISAVRAPGSTLKPFIYGLAIDKGILTPQSILNDVPIDFSGYSPSNYDEKFHGQVSMANSLENSLNIPAVKTLNKIKVPTLIDLLIQSDFKSITKNKNNLGLSLALGGCGLTLAELTNLYTVLANEGKWSSLNWLKLNTEQREKKQLLSPQSAFIISDILNNLTRPDLPKNFANAAHLPKIAWKTGTSYGRRDAWSIGYNPNYTVGVWVGNFTGVGSPELTGAEIATPLLINIFNTIDYNSKKWFKMPNELELRYVCSHTGNIPNDFCDNQVLDYNIPGISSTKICEHLIKQWVSLSEAISYCTSCLPTNNQYKTKNYSNYSGDLISYFEEESIPYDIIPKHNPACERIFQENKPKIMHPSANVTYLIDTTEQQSIMLKCNASNDVAKIYWYINNELVGSVEKHHVFTFVPKTFGNTKISCSDDKGRNTDIYIEIEAL